MLMVVLAEIVIVNTRLHISILCAITKQKCHQSSPAQSISIDMHIFIHVYKQKLWKPLEIGIPFGSPSACDGRHM
jgi:hypothetical protein